MYRISYYLNENNGKKIPYIRKVVDYAAKYPILIKIDQAVENNPGPPKSTLKSKVINLALDAAEVVGNAGVATVQGIGHVTTEYGIPAVEAAGSAALHAGVATAKGIGHATTEYGIPAAVAVGGVALDVGVGTIKGVGHAATDYAIPAAGAVVGAALDVSVGTIKGVGHATTDYAIPAAGAVVGAALDVSVGTIKGVVHATTDYGIPAAGAVGGVALDVGVGTIKGVGHATTDYAIPAAGAVVGAALDVSVGTIKGVGHATTDYAIPAAGAVVGAALDVGVGTIKGVGHATTDYAIPAAGAVVGAALDVSVGTIKGVGHATTDYAIPAAAAVVGAALDASIATAKGVGHATTDYAIPAAGAVGGVALDVGVGTIKGVGHATTDYAIPAAGAVVGAALDVGVGTIKGVGHATTDYAIPAAGAVVGAALDVSVGTVKGVVHATTDYAIPAAGAVVGAALVVSVGTIKGVGHATTDYAIPAAGAVGGVALDVGVGTIKGVGHAATDYAIPAAEAIGNSALHAGVATAKGIGQVATDYGIPAAEAIGNAALHAGVETAEFSKEIMEMLELEFTDAAINVGRSAGFFRSQSFPILKKAYFWMSAFVDLPKIKAMLPHSLGIRSEKLAIATKFLAGYELIELMMEIGTEEMNKLLENYTPSINAINNNIKQEVNELKEYIKSYRDINANNLKGLYKSGVKELRDDLKSLFISALNTHISCASLDSSLERKLVKKFLHLMDPELLNELLLRSNIDAQKEFLDNSDFVNKINSLTLETLFKSYSISQNTEKYSVAEYILEKAPNKISLELLLLSLEMRKDAEYFKKVFLVAQGAFMDDKVAAIVKYMVDNYASNPQCAKFLEYIKVSASEASVQELAKTLARVGDTELNSKVYKFISERIHADKENYLYPSVIDSCFVHQDNISKLNLNDIDLEHLTIAQNNCDTLVKLKSGKRLLIKGHNAEKVYEYIKEHVETPMEDRTKKFIAYFHPSHAFMGVKSADKSYVAGFSPRSDFNSDEVDSSFKGAQYIGGSIAAVALIPSLPLCLATGSSPLYAGMFAIVTALTGVSYASYTKQIHLFDRKIGNVGDETAQKLNSKIANSPRVEFLISDDEFAKINTYIENTKNACKENNFDQCAYQVIEHNCVNFVSDVFNAAGYDGAAGAYLSEEQLNSYELSYSRKALLYSKAESLILEYANHAGNIVLLDSSQLS